MKLAIGSDHQGLKHKKNFLFFFKKENIDFIDVGCNIIDGKVDYPDFVHPVCNLIIQKKVDIGILICATGNGVAMTANKYKLIRCALVWNDKIAILAKEHNNANIISFPANYISIEKSIALFNLFLKSNFKKGRHKIRLNKMINI